MGIEGGDEGRCGHGGGAAEDVQWTWILSPATVGRLQSTAVTTSVLRCCDLVSDHAYAGTCSSTSTEGLWAVTCLVVDSFSGERSRGKGKDGCELHVGQLKSLV